MAKQNWQPADGLTLEQVATQVVKSESNSLVIAGPGAGKTELLAQRACFLLETNECKAPRKILAISFKKDAAKNLAERVEKRCGTELTKRFHSMTYDAFAKSLVDRFYSAIPEEYRPSPVYEIAVADKEHNDIRYAYELAGFEPPRTMREKDINDLLEKEIVRHPLPLVESSGYPTKRAWELLLAGGDSKTSRMSFPMITRLVTYLIQCNPQLMKSLQITYSHVFLDEFQDTTRIQYELVKTCFHHSKSIMTAVGDSKQRIMVWAGAMREVFPTYKADFQSNEFQMVMNHRSAPRLVEIQKVFFSRFNEQPIPIQTSSRWQDSDGLAYLHMFDNQTQEATTITNIVKRMIDDGSHTPNDICILVKQSVDKYCNELVSTFKSCGIRARNEGIYQEFLKEDFVTLCLNTIIISLRRDAAAWMYCRNILLDIKKKNEDDPEVHALLKELSHFISDVKSDLKNAANEIDLSNIVQKIIDYYSVDAIKSIFPQYLRSNYLSKLSAKLTKWLWEERAQAGSMILAIDSLLGKSTLPIMTIHKSKGLEYKTIFFLGLEDAAFFKYSSQKEEDTAAFFVALSRAKHTLHFTFSSARDFGTYSTQRKRVIEDFYRALADSGVVETVNHSLVSTIP